MQTFWQRCIDVLRRELHPVSDTERYNRHINEMMPEIDERERKLTRLVSGLSRELSGFERSYRRRRDA